MARKPAGSPLPPEVELVEPEVEPAIEPEAASFQVVDTLPSKPATDVLIKVDGTGMLFRERLIDMSSLSVPEGRLAPGLNLSISNALADKNGSVELGASGVPKIVPPQVCHEIQIDGERMGRMPPAEIEAEIERNRGIAAAKARDYFIGMERGRSILRDRGIV